MELHWKFFIQSIVKTFRTSKSETPGLVPEARPGIPTVRFKENTDLTFGSVLALHETESRIHEVSLSLMLQLNSSVVLESSEVAFIAQLQLHFGRLHDMVCKPMLTWVLSIPTAARVLFEPSGSPISGKVGEANGALRINLV